MEYEVQPCTEDDEKFIKENLMQLMNPLCFRKHGYSICAELTEFPGEGHCSYELEKQF